MRPRSRRIPKKANFTSQSCTKPAPRLLIFSSTSSQASSKPSHGQSRCAGALRRRSQIVCVGCGRFILLLRHLVQKQKRLRSFPSQSVTSKQPRQPMAIALCRQRQSALNALKTMRCRSSAPRSFLMLHGAATLFFMTPRIWPLPKD